MPSGPETAPAPGQAEPRTIVCRVTAVEQAARDIYVVRLARDGGEPLTHTAGQYARVAFDDQPERDYSIASRPSASEFEFHIRNMNSGPSHYVATALKPGERATVRGPFGATYLRTDHSGPIVAIGGGSGLAPMKAIVEEALARGMTQPISLYAGVRDEPDLYLVEHFRALEARHPNFRFIPVLSHPSGPTAHRTGMVPDAVAADLPDLSRAKAYLAGPPPMVEAALQRLPELGIAADNLHADSFIGEAERRQRDGE
ncbi:NAD(P)H-flavin reductase [Limimonas halophila]|nr:NAD(P)H-flavin reductase [Limimonas halophila]